MQIIENIISAEECVYLSHSIDIHYKNIQKQYPNQSFGDGLVKDSFSAYALPETEDLLLILTPIVSKLIGREIFPTYSYCRIYFKGAELRPHVDRAACEISMSLCISGDPWALHFDSGPITLTPGNAVLYQGLEYTHWREPFNGDSCTQVFLHWVSAKGPNADWKYDRRPNIGAKESEKTYWGKS